MLGRVDGDALSYRSPSPLPEPSLDSLTGDDGCGPLERGSFLAQGHIHIFGKGKMKVLHGAYHNGSFHDTILWHASWQVKSRPRVEMGVDQPFLEVRARAMLTRTRCAG